MADDDDDVPSPTYHRRQLPSTCIAFASKRGREIFKRSLGAGNCEAFFALAEQFRTQDEPAYCGLATLVMCLNAMAVDPGRVWKGVWRWFSEDMLACCVDIDVVKKTGIHLDEFACLARCNGLNCDLKRGTECTVDEFRKDVIACCSTITCSEAAPCCQYLCVNYDRQTLGQTGSGHFSPVAGYDALEDLVLILDTARFKYPPHWIPLHLLHAAIPSGGRGYATLSPGKDESGCLCIGSDHCVLPGFDNKGQKECKSQPAQPKDDTNLQHNASCARCGN